MKAIRGRKKSTGAESYFLAHTDTVIVEEGGTKKTLTQKLGSINASTINGYSIQVVSAMPPNPSANTIYIVQ